MHHGKQHQLQYLIHWKGYSATDDTWEPTDQVHAKDLVKKYHQSHPQDERRYKTTKKVWAKSITFLTPSCHQPTLQMSPLPLPLTSQLTWTSLRPSQVPHKLRHWWSTDRTASQFPQKLWQGPTNSVSCPSPQDPHVPLWKGMTPPAKSNSFTLPKKWQELCTRTKKSLGATANSWKYSSSKEMLWQSSRQTWLALKKPMNIERQTVTKGSLTGIKRSEGQRGMKKTKDTSLIFSSQSLTVTTP